MATSTAAAADQPGHSYPSDCASDLPEDVKAPALWPPRSSSSSRSASHTHLGLAQDSLGEMIITPPLADVLSNRYSSPPAVAPTKADTRRFHALIELVSTELGYLHDLRVLVQIYLSQLPSMLPVDSRRHSSSAAHAATKTKTAPFSAASVNPSNQLLNAPSPSPPATASSSSSNSRSFSDLPFLARSQSALSIHRKSRFISSPPTGAFRVTPKPILSDADISLVTRNAPELLALHDRLVNDLTSVLARFGVSLAAGSVVSDSRAENVDDSKHRQTVSEPPSRRNSADRPFPGAPPRTSSPSLVTTSSTSPGYWVDSFLAREHALVTRIDELANAVSSVFISEAQIESFDIYEAFCAQHPQVLDLIRKTAERFPSEWTAFEARCAGARAQVPESPFPSPVQPGVQSGDTVSMISESQRPESKETSRRKTFELPTEESDEEEDDEEDPDIQEEEEENTTVSSFIETLLGIEGERSATSPSAPTSVVAGFTLSSEGASHVLVVQSPAPQLDPDKSLKPPGPRIRRHSVSSLSSPPSGNCGQVRHARRVSLEFVKGEPPTLNIPSGATSQSTPSGEKDTPLWPTVDPPRRLNNFSRRRTSKFFKRRSVDLKPFVDENIPSAWSAPTSPARPQHILPVDVEQPSPAISDRWVTPPSKLAFLDYLIKPIQRICKYPLLLEQLRVQFEVPVASSDSGSSVVDGVALVGGSDQNGEAKVEKALREMRRVAERVNEARRRQDVLAKSALIASRIHVPPTRPGSSSYSRANGLNAMGVMSASLDRSATLLQQQDSGVNGKATVAAALDVPLASQQNQRQPKHITPSFLASLGAYVLAGSLDVVHHHPVKNPLRTSSSRKVKYLGAFLYPGGYLVLVKVGKGEVYELRHWFSLSGFDITDLDDEQALLPSSFRLSFKDHHIEMSAACQKEKEIWLSALQRSRKSAPPWTDEPVSSLLDSELELQPVMAPPLATIESSSAITADQLEPSREISFPIITAAVSRSASTTRMSRLSTTVTRHGQHFLITDPSPTLRVPPSRRSSTNSVKSIFSAIGSATSSTSSMSGGGSAVAETKPTSYLLHRASLRDRRFVEQGLSDVISEQIIVGRVYAQTHDEELFRQPADGQPAPAYTRLTKRDSLRVAPRRHHTSFESSVVNGTELNLSRIPAGGVMSPYHGATPSDIDPSHLDVSIKPSQPTVLEPPEKVDIEFMDSLAPRQEKYLVPETLSRRRSLFGSRQLFPPNIPSLSRSDEHSSGPSSRPDMPSIVEPSTSERSSTSRGIFRSMSILLNFSPLVANGHS